MGSSAKKNALKRKASSAQEKRDDNIPTVVEDQEMPLTVVDEEVAAPIVASYNDRIRPLLDCVDKLRHLKIMQEGIQLPTIVVIGDQSSGKSSVLESLASISLPRGHGICTRVPLIMRLQSHKKREAELFLEYNGKVMPTDELNIVIAIDIAAKEIAGSGKGISNTSLTLIVKKSGVPDLTMVDLPGITRVPVRGQPEDIYEQISAIMMEYIRPKESIILNVLSASVDFTTCESIRMSQKVDKTGERTLAVVTKADKAPEGLLEKITIQANIISQCLPDIVRKINEKLAANVSDLNKLPQNLATVADAMAAFVHIVSNAKESLRKILLRGEFDEYPDDIHMHCTARLAEMLNKYSDQLQANCVENESRDNFLIEELRVLDEAKGVGLPNFLPRPAFLTILQRKMEGIVVPILMRHSDSYPQLLCSARRSAENLVAKKLEQSKEWVQATVAMERLADYRCNPEYDATWNKLMAQQHAVMEVLKDPTKNPNVTLDGFGCVRIGHLRNHLGDIQQAFDMKMRMTAYWKIVLRRLVDAMALHLLHSIHYLVNGELEKEIVAELMSPHGGGIERILEESPALSDKRSRLKRSIKLLKESKDLVSNKMDKVASYGDSISCFFS